LAKLQARAWLSQALCALGQHTAKKTKKVYETIVFLLVTLQTFTDFIFFTLTTGLDISRDAKNMPRKA